MHMLYISVCVMRDCLAQALYVDCAMFVHNEQPCIDCVSLDAYCLYLISNMSM